MIAYTMVRCAYHAAYGSHRMDFFGQLCIQGVSNCCCFCVKPDTMHMFCTSSIKEDALGTLAGVGETFNSIKNRTGLYMKYQIDKESKISEHMIVLESSKRKVEESANEACWSLVSGFCCKSSDPCLQKCPL